MAKEKEKFDLSIGVRIDKNTDVEKVIEFATHADKSSKLTENAVKQAQSMLEDDEEILYIALCDVAYSYSRLKKSVTVLTDRRIIFLRPEKMMGSFKDPLKVEADFTLDCVTEFGFELEPVFSRRRLYLRIKAKTSQIVIYDVELPMNTLLPNANTKYEAAIYAAFDGAIARYNKKLDDEARQAGDLAQLEQLKDLLDRGLITEQDYEAKKKQILGL